MRKILTVVVILSFILSAYSMKTRQERFMEIGRQYFEMGYYNDALVNFDKAIEKNPANTEYYYWKGKALIALKQYRLAKENLEIYLKKNYGADTRNVKKLTEIIDVDSVMKDTLITYHSIGRLPSYLNSQYSDYAPLITPDGKTMYFTSRRVAELKKENVWKVDKVNSYWGKPNLVKDLSSDYNEALGCIDFSTNTAYMFASYKNRQGNIYFSEFNQNWSIPEEIEEVSSEKYDMHPYVYNDEVMFLTSNRKGSIGGMDLYVSEKIGNSWTEPKNLGFDINSDGNEVSPFLDWDGETLYFASNGLPGLGGYDLYKAEKDGESWQEWTEPENLGVTINSVRDEKYYFKCKDKDMVYISSNRIGGRGFYDIYRFDEKNVKYMIRPDDVIISGLVTDEEDNPVKTEVVWEYLINDENVADVIVTDEEGYYEISLPEVKEYTYKVKEKNYFNANGTIQLGEKERIEHDIVLKKIEKGETYVFHDILFDFNKATIKEDSYQILNNLAETIKNNDLKIEIEGHTDNIGDEAYNLKLSNERAEAVVDYLLEKGVDKNNIIAQGLGESAPIAENETEEGRAKNRRVEMNVLEDDDSNQ